MQHRNSKWEIHCIVCGKNVRVRIRAKSNVNKCLWTAFCFIVALTSSFVAGVNVHHLIQSMFMADSGANLSDHRSLVGHFRLHDLLVHTRTPRTNHEVNTVLPAWRWDKPDIGLYYENSRQALSQVSLPVSCYSCAMGCNNITNQNVINNYYIVYNVSWICRERTAKTANYCNYSYFV